MAQVKAIEKPFTLDELKAMQAKDGRIVAVISRDWQETGDIEALNDDASLFITDSEVGLEDIAYSLVGVDTEKQEVLIEVSGVLSEYWQDGNGDGQEQEPLLDGTKWLFLAEIANTEAPGVPTLRSALESVESGYCPDPDELVDMGPIKAQVERLILANHGGSHLKHFVTDQDWKDREEGDLQARARKGH